MDAGVRGHARVATHHASPAVRSPRAGRRHQRRHRLPARALHRPPSGLAARVATLWRRRRHTAFAGGAGATLRKTRARRCSERCARTAVRTQLDARISKFIHAESMSGTVWRSGPRRRRQAPVHKNCARSSAGSDPTGVISLLHAQLAPRGPAQNEPGSIGAMCSYFWAQPILSSVREVRKTVWGDTVTERSLLAGLRMHLGPSAKAVGLGHDTGIRRRYLGRLRLLLLRSCCAANRTAGPQAPRRAAAKRTCAKPIAAVSFSKP